MPLPQLDPFVVRWQGVKFERDARADATKVKQPGKPTKDAPPKATYRKGSVAEKYGPMFEGMPPLNNEMPRENSEVLTHIMKVVQESGEACDDKKAQRIFDNLRQKFYSFITFKDGFWQGRNYEGGVS